MKNIPNLCKTGFFLTVILASAGAPLRTEAQNLIVAMDSADAPHYDGGWNPGSGNDTSFGPWRFSSSEPGSKSLVDLLDKTDIPRVETFPEKRAFVLSSSPDEPNMVAWRKFNALPEQGDLFSLCLIASSPITDGEGVVGISLLSAPPEETTGGTEVGAELQFCTVEGRNTYHLIDGDGSFDTGVKADGQPISVSFLFLPENKYIAQIAVLGEGVSDVKHVTNMEARKFAGGGDIKYFATFNRNRGLNGLAFGDIVLERNVGN